LRDQKIVEVEIAESVVERVMKWTRNLAFFVGIPLILLVGALTVWGIKSFADFQKIIATKQADVERELSDVILREYMHHVLLGQSLGGENALSLLESGLASYFPCSFKGDPRFAPSISGGDWNLKNTRKITELDLQDTAVRFSKAIPVWGGVFWELRENLGRDTADGLLLKTWFALASQKKLTDLQIPSRFASVLLETAGKHEAGQHSARIRSILSSRGFQW
jgi:hypothetical protein